MHPAASANMPPTIAAARIDFSLPVTPAVFATPRITLTANERRFNALPLVRTEGRLNRGDAARVYSIGLIASTSVLIVVPKVW
jgi:hypothetical protein